MKPDRELVDAVIAGNLDDFEILVKRYERLVFGTAASILHDKHAAQDVSQDAFLTAYEKLRSLKNGDSFGSWIVTITRRHAYRTSSRLQRIKTQQDQADAATTQSNGRLDDESKELLTLIQRLSEPERVVVVLKYFDQHSVGDIASMTGQSVGTITKKLTRARARLHAWIKEMDK